MYLNLPIVIGLIRLFPQHGRWSPVVGLLISCSSLAMSSFSQNTTHLIVTQGILYAIGGSISYTPCILYMDEWFIKRKGIAYGIMWSGTGLAGFVLPLLLSYFLDQYGFRTTLRIWSLTLFCLAVPLAYYIKPRLPHTATRHIKPFKLSFALKRTFLLHQSANVIQAIGFFLPGVYLPTYARSIGASAFLSALTILLVNVASVFGCIAMGSLTDRLHVTTCLMISTLGTAIGTFMVWGFATSLPVLYLFCVIYGLFAGSYSTTWAGIMHHVVSAPSRADEARLTGARSTFDPIMVLGALSFGRGVGNIVSGPLSEGLVKGLPWQGQAFGAYGSGFGPLVVVTGITAFVGSAPFLWRRIGWM